MIQPEGCRTMKTYEVYRHLDSGIVNCRVTDDTTGAVWYLTHVVLHSPDGFNYGYMGSGPADLALSILADHFDEQPTQAILRAGRCRCWFYHKQFTAAFIANQKGDLFVINADAIDAWHHSRKDTEKDVDFTG